MASSVTGAIVGTFKVGMGVKVGPPIFKPDKPKLLLKGKTFTTSVIAGDVKRVQLAKAKLTLNPRLLLFNASSTPRLILNPKLIMRGKPIRLVTPTKAVLGKAKLTLRGKHLNRVTSYTIQPKKAKIILEGGNLGRVGKAGMVPSPPVTIILTPSPAQEGLLVPTAAYTELLVPTVEEFV